MAASVRACSPAVGENPLANIVGLDAFGKDLKGAFEDVTAANACQPLPAIRCTQRPRDAATHEARCQTMGRLGSVRTESWRARESSLGRNSVSMNLTLFCTGKAASVPVAQSVVRGGPAGSPCGRPAAADPGLARRLLQRAECACIAAAQKSRRIRQRWAQASETHGRSGTCGVEGEGVVPRGRAQQLRGTWWQGHADRRGGRPS
jgi:hypothetical protein